MVKKSTYPSVMGNDDPTTSPVEPKLRMDPSQRFQVSQVIMVGQLLRQGDVALPRKEPTKTLEDSVNFCCGCFLIYKSKAFGGSLGRYEKDKDKYY